MTNQQGAPNALRSIARYTIGYVTDDWGMRSSTPGGIQDPAGAWVRYEDHLAALVEAQQPAPSAAADLIAALEEARSAINSMKVEAETAGQGDEQMMLEACETISNEGLQADMAIRAALASAPRPVPSAAEAPLPLLVRDIAADLGTTPIQVCTALAQLGFGGHSVNMAVTPRMAQSLRAHFASPTPQADSQPAKVELFNPLEGGNLETELQMAAVIALRDSQPALPEITAEDRSFLHYNPNTDDIVEWVQHYASAAITADRAMRAKAAPAAVASPLTKLQRKAIAVCFTSDKVSVSEVQRKLSISYADAQTLCQSIVDLGLTDELELAPSLKRGAPASQPAPVAHGDAQQRAMDARHAAIYRWIIQHIDKAASIIDAWREDGEADKDELHDALAARAANAGIQARP